MRALVVISILSVAAFFMLSCQGPQRVQASSENGAIARRQVDEPIPGTLHSVDLTTKTMVIRVENGMAQTFRWDETTVVTGSLPDNEIHSRSKSKETAGMMKQLTQRRGSEVRVDWTELQDEKLATTVNVIDLAAVSRPLRKRRSTHR